MLKNHFLILYRNLNKNRLYFLINVLGLSIAIGCCVVAYFNYNFNASFDCLHTNASLIYRVNTVRDGRFMEHALAPGEASREYGVAPVPLGEMIRQNVKNVESLSRYTPKKIDVRVGNEIFSVKSAYVDPDFFTMFSFQFIHGSRIGMSGKSKIVISREIAIKYFGNENAVNKGLTYLGSDNVKKEFVVTGVYEMAKNNSSFIEDMYLSYENYWDVSHAPGSGANWKEMNTLFVQLPHADRVQTIEQQLNTYVKNNNDTQDEFLIQEFKLDPFMGMAVRDVMANRPGTVTHQAHALASVIGFAVMSIIILLIACFNLTNTSIALSQRRLKEIGIRKMMGSVRAQLILQYISETMLICLLSLVIGLGMAESFLLPSFNELMPFMKLEADYIGEPHFIIFILGTLFFTGLIAGSYPAFYVSKFNPVAILKGKLRFGGNNFATYFLLGAQLVLSLCGIVCGFALIDNSRWQNNFDMGFSVDTGIITYVENKADYENYRNALTENKHIRSITGSSHHFQSDFYQGTIMHEGQMLDAIIMEVGDDYLETTGMTLLEGRDFMKDSENDRSEAVIVTEEFVRWYGWDTAIGKQVVWKDTVKLYVVGVVKDVYSLWEPLTPMMLRYASDKANFVIVRTEEDKIEEVNAFMKEKWKTIFPDRLYSSRFTNSGTLESGMVNDAMRTMFLFLGGVALLLSVTGLFTLVSLNVIKRMKEIGVRKLMGATFLNITRIINTEFALIVPIGCIIGLFAGKFLSELLMRSIWDHYQKPTVVTLIISSAILMTACVVSVSVKTYETVKMNPADVLKDE